MKKLLLSVFVLSALLIGCGDDDSTPSILTSELTLNISGLEDLGDDYVYEGWIIVADAPISTGTFSVGASGTLSETTFSITTSVLDLATKFVLSIEPAGETGAAALEPSSQKLIAGDFSGGNTATLSTSVAPAIGDFSNAAGGMFLRTPTDEVAGTENNGNDFNGVWFGNPGTPPSAGLTLPTLPTGWVYEGWVVTSSGPISTGTFTSFDAVDSGNPFSGTENNAGPPVPGEDFFVSPPEDQDFPLDVRGKTIVISVEPVPDNLASPFLLKPLATELAVDAPTAPTVHLFLQNIESSFPTGTVTR